MQLFITHHIQINNDQQTILINDARVLHQCIQVLRYKVWNEIVIQNQWVRYTVVLLSRDKNQLHWSIKEQIAQKSIDVVQSNKKTLIVAMSNKRDKIELIAQKSAEIGVDNLIIWIAMRSVIKTLSDHKLTRLRSILIEASEQSRNRHTPVISILHTLQELPMSYVAHQDGLYCFDTRAKKNNTTNPKESSLSSLIVWPEWWFDPKELAYMQSQCFPMISFGSSILRTETAALIGGRRLVSH